MTEFATESYLEAAEFAGIDQLAAIWLRKWRKLRRDSPVYSPIIAFVLDHDVDTLRKALAQVAEKAIARAGQYTPKYALEDLETILATPSALTQPKPQKLGDGCDCDEGWFYWDEYSEADEIEYGYAAPCPKCHQPGFLEHVDRYLTRNRTAEDERTNGTVSAHQREYLEQVLDLLSNAERQP